METTVEYRDVPGYPFYRVGNDGSVWSRRGGGGHVRSTWHQLKPIKQRNGRYHVRLCGHDKVHNLTVHKVVMLAFVGPRPEGLEIAHDDGDTSNNRLSNLRYTTRVDNEADKLRHGTRSRGESHGCAKLTEKDVIAIRKDRARGIAVKEIARRFKVTASTVCNITLFHNWKHLSAEEVSS